MIVPAIVNVSWKVQPPLKPRKFTFPLKLLPHIAIVLPVVVASKSTLPKKIWFIAVAKASEPYIFKTGVEPPAKVGVLVTPVQVMFLQYAVGAVIVTAFPVDENEFASKKTLSKGEGEQPDGVPPLVSAQ